jgi:hypothetical protein
VKSASRSSRHSEERPWLKDKVYDPRRRRTIELMRSSVASLMRAQKRVSLAALSARSKEIDPDGRGISQSTILKNQEARTYYEQHRSWTVGSGNRQRICKPKVVTVPPIKGDRDGGRVRYRYLKLNKAELVERLLGVEQAHAVLQERWFQVNEQMLSWRLRAERLDPQLRRREE